MRRLMYDCYESDRFHDYQHDAEEPRPEEETPVVLSS
jgi:hypothetical protein